MVIPDETSPPPGWGTPGLDDLLGAFAPGQLSEIVGSWSSGASSLLNALVARATTSGHVAVVDAMDAFDPTSASAAGTDLSRLLWVRCGGRVESALRSTDLLARCPGFALVALDVGSAGAGRGRGLPASPVYLRLRRAVEGSPTILVLRAPERLAGSAAALVVSVRRLGWQWMGLPRPTRLAGLTSEVRVVRSRAPGAGLLEARGCWRIEWRL